MDFFPMTTLVYLVFVRQGHKFSSLDTDKKCFISQLGPNMNVSNEKNYVVDQTWNKYESFRDPISTFKEFPQESHSILNVFYQQFD